MDPLNDVNELAINLRKVLGFISECNFDDAQKCLRISKGIVNISDTIDPHAKVFLTSVFAEFHLVIDNKSVDSDSLYDHYIKGMIHMYGPNHIAMSDCYAMISSIFASYGRIVDAIEYCEQALVIRTMTLGLVHGSTADSHFNLGILHRLNGNLQVSRKELRICRGIRKVTFGEESLEVAMVDLSIAQTERLLFEYENAYVHFFLCYRTRALLLGVGHALTSRAWDLAKSVRYACGDRLVTSIELLDRVEQLQWLNYDLSPDECVGDVDAVVYEAEEARYLHEIVAFLLSELFSSSSAGNPGTRKTGVGECLLVRSSFLRKILRESIIQCLTAASQVKRGHPRQRHTGQSALMTSFENSSNLHRLLSEVESKLLPPDSLSSDSGLIDESDARAPSDLSQFYRDQHQARRSRCVQSPDHNQRVQSPDPSQRVQSPDHNQRVQSPDPSQRVKGRERALASGFDEPLEDVNVDAHVSPSDSLLRHSPVLHVTPVPPFESDRNDTARAGESGATVMPAVVDATADERVASEDMRGVDDVGVDDAPVPTVQLMSPHEEPKDRDRDRDRDRDKDRRLRLDKHQVLLDEDCMGRRIVIKHLQVEDLIHALRIKLLAAGVFPYLALNAVAPPPVKHEAVTVTEPKVVEAKKEEAIAPTADVALKEEAKAKVVKKIPLPPPLPSQWPPVVVDGKNAEVCGGAATKAGGLGGLLGAIGGGLGLLKQNKGGAGGGKGASSKAAEPPGPKRKQLHWEMLSTVSGTMWEEKAAARDDGRDDQSIDAKPVDTADMSALFPDLVELFTPAPKENAKNASTPSLSGKSKQIQLLDGQKSQNINIMLSKFGSQRRVADIIEAVCDLRVEAFTLPTIHSMIEFAPSSFADGGEIALITKTAREQGGGDRLGKAERYLLEMSQVPKIESLLRVLQLLLSFGDVKDQTMQAANVLNRATTEVRQSTTLKTIFKAILSVGNILNEGSKKSSAAGFRISSLPKLTQTKANSGENLLEYILSRLGRDAPEVFALKSDFASLEVAKLVSIPTLQADLSKIEKSLSTMQRFIEELGKASGGDSSTPTVDPRVLSTLPKLLQYEKSFIAEVDSLKAEFLSAQAKHSDLCVYLGEDKGTDPETIYGQLLSFALVVDSIGTKYGKKKFNTT